MTARSKPEEVPPSLEERLRNQVRLLLHRLADQSTTEEIEAEIERLDERITDFKEQDDLLAKLLDPLTPRTELWKTIRQLPEPVRAEESHRELQRIYNKSHELIQESVRLITDAQRQVDASRNLRSQYAREICGFCKGFGGTADRPCPVCSDARNVSVHQPALKCPRCEGTGHGNDYDSSLQDDTRCVVCLGSGWVFSRAVDSPKT